MATIARAIHHDRNSVRDYALVGGSYFLGCRFSEIAGIKRKDIEVVSDGGQIHLFSNGSKARTVRVSSDMIKLFQLVGPGDAYVYVIQSLRGKAHPTQQEIGNVDCKWKVELDFTSTHTN